MASIMVCEKFLEAFACAHINEGLFEDDKWDMVNCFMQTKGSPILRIKDLKDRGNNLFKQNCFGGAASYYDEAFKLLSLVVGMEGSYDTKSLSELAVSLNLNLAACALKLLEHEASKDLCSIVLSFFPRNVKALFRRGLAFMKLNKFLEAQSDLEAALLVEPRNKDILREVSVVKSCLAINSNGKRSIDDHLLQDPFGKNKIHVQDAGPRRNTPIESGESSDSSSCGGLTSDHNNVISYASGSCFQSSVTEKCDMALDTNMLVSDQESCTNSGSTSTRESSCNLDDSAKVKVNYVDNIGPNRDMNRDHNGVEKAMFQFSKKGGGHSVLKIDECTYKKLLKGKEVSFFQQSHLSTMKIRVFKPSISEPDTDTGSFTSQKKKRKRRRKRKEYLRTGSVTSAGTTTVTDNTKSDILPLPSVIRNKSIDCDPTLEKVASSLSHFNGVRCLPESQLETLSMISLSSFPLSSSLATPETMGVKPQFSEFLCLSSFEV